MRQPSHLLFIVLTVDLPPLSTDGTPNLDVSQPRVR